MPDLDSTVIQGEAVIRLHFQGISPTYSATLGPAPWFRIAGNFIRQGPHGEIVGTLRRHHWEVQSEYFCRYDCTDPVVIHFEDAAGGQAAGLGPFTKFHAADGVMYADDKLFAKFIEETQLWHCYVDENFWPIMVIKPVSASGG